MPHRLASIRPQPAQTCSIGKQCLVTGLCGAAGLVMGLLIKRLDIDTTNLGNVFSQLSVWILLGTAIAVYSTTPKRAAVNVFAFCACMLLTYYWTAEVTGSVYSRTFLYGWAAFSCLSPVLAWLAWYAKGRGAIAMVLRVGILLTTALTAILLFDRLRWYDLLILGLEAAILFLHRRVPIEKKQSNKEDRR